MHKKTTDGWEYKPEMELLMIFAYLVDEMTFVYTTDSYKAPALNVMSLIDETYSAIIDVERGLTKEAALPTLKDELSHNLNEKVFTDMIKSMGLYHVVAQINKETDIRTLKHALEIIRSKDLNMEYLKRLKEEISQTVKDGIQKKYLEDITKTFVTQLKNIGYSNDSIYYTNQVFFFNKKSDVKHVNRIDDYLNLYSCKESSYTVVHIGNPLFEKVKTAFQKVGDDVTDNFDLGIQSESLNKFMRKKSNTQYFVVTHVKALDFFSAREKSIARIKEKTNLFSFYHHKNTMDINNECFGLDEEAKVGRVIKRPTPIIIRCKDERPEGASRHFEDAVNKLNMNDDSMRRIYKSLKLHEASLNSDNIENQFINIFTALEVLMPKNSDSGKSRVDQMAETLIPYLCVNYVERLIDPIYLGLKRWRATSVKDIRLLVKEDGSDIEKLCAFMILAKYDKSGVDKLYADLEADDYMFMIFRMWRMNSILKEVPTLKGMIESHHNRIKWHINRIYRTRNMIVHSGTVPEYINVLLENIHSYYDMLIKAVINDYLVNGFDSLEMSFSSTSLAYCYYMNLLKNSLKQKIHENNFKTLVLNHQN